MSRNTPRSLAVVAGVLAVGMSIAPAFAVTPTARPTSLTLKAAHSTVTPGAKDTLTATLKSGKTLLAGETVTLKERAYGSKNVKTLGTYTTLSKGQIVLHVTPVSKSAHKGQKVQLELFFSGNSTYKASHSAVITITVS